MAALLCFEWTYSFALADGRWTRAHTNRRHVLHVLTPINDNTHWKMASVWTFVILRWLTIYSVRSLPCRAGCMLLSDCFNRRHSNFGRFSGIDDLWRCPKSRPLFAAKIHSWRMLLGQIVRDVSGANRIYSRQFNGVLCVCVWIQYPCLISLLWCSIHFVRNDCGGCTTHCSRHRYAVCSLPALVFHISFSCSSL